ncbi:hypothetical protein [Clostridium akagii]|uniref:hypothetical protein n=1 Tax=Clostridium akagii TaxID=91623 RepID=UPI0005628104|nr:hypothetical protein [Clostridium akagii]
MWIIEFLQKFLEGRGFYPSLMVIFSWGYTILLVGVLICEIFLYIFKVKYYNPEFKKDVNKKV